MGIKHLLKLFCNLCYGFIAQKCNYLIGNAAHDIWLSHVISYNLITYFNFKTQD